MEDLWIQTFLLAKDCLPGNLDGGGTYSSGNCRCLVKYGEIVVCRLSIFILPNRRPPQRIIRSLKLCLGGSINGSVERVIGCLGTV